METLTFALAVAGYAGLTMTVVLMERRPGIPRLLWWVTIAAIASHVALVWVVRYDWRFATATRNGYAAFVIFHLALALAVASLVTSAARARQAIRVAFVVVTVGAVGAVFRYDDVARYRVPVGVLAVVGMASLGRVLTHSLMRRPLHT